MLDPSLRKNLVHEDRWFRVYQPDPKENFFAYESKFEADEISVTLEEISAEGNSWNDDQRLMFAQAFAKRSHVNESDQEIYEWLIAKGDERVWSTISLPLAHRHANKKLVLNFLLERLRGGSEPKANSIQALCVLGDLEAVPRLRELHDRLSQQSSHGADFWIIYDFISCCKALAYLEGGRRYLDEIQAFLDHPEERIRHQAQIALAGPQLEEFGDSI